MSREDIVLPAHLFNGSQTTQEAARLINVYTPQKSNA